MNIVRKGFDLFYDSIKPVVFSLTAKDPETAHKLFVNFCRTLDGVGLAKLVFDNDSNGLNPDFKISNAAGFNKNGKIPPNILRYLGFDRNVVGTVTYDSWNGNPRPRTRRYIDGESLVNWMGLPGEGANFIFDKLSSYGFQIPTTISIMSTPGKQGEEALRDIESTVLTFRNLSYVRRFQLNTSCPNTHNQSGELDARKENERWLGDMLGVVRNTAYANQEIELKVSPDLNKDEVQNTIIISKGYVGGFITTNTTRIHDTEHIPESPGKGVASGNALYSRSLEIQKMFDEVKKLNGLDFRITACGGIDSIGKLKERLANGATEIEIYTPFIFKGPKLLRELRTYIPNLS